MKIWQCTVCGYIHRGEQPPEKCPVCNVPASKFKEISEDQIPEKQRAKASPAKTQAVPPAPPKPETGMEKIKSLLVRHHLHPISVHSPNGLLPVAFVLFFLSWVCHCEFLAKAAVVNLIFAIVSLPVVLFTGGLEWRKKYRKAMTSVFIAKILSATLASASAVIALVWYWIDPKVLASENAGIFICLNLFMTACAGIAGHIGGKLVFKD